MESVEKEKLRRIDIIDAARGISILLMVAYHFGFDLVNAEILPYFIVFNENFHVEKYFDYFANQEIHAYVIYTYSENKITFSTAFSYLPPEILEYIPVSETFEFVLKGNSLTIKDFSNPFSGTFEMRRDVHFTKIK